MAGAGLIRLLTTISFTHNLVYLKVFLLTKQIFMRFGSVLFGFDKKNPGRLHLKIACIIITIGR